MCRQTRRRLAVRAKPGSVRAIARELLKQYGLRYATWFPLGVAVIVGGVSAGLCPGTLEDNSVYDHWNSFFASSAQLIGALVVALAVEARTPFARTGEAAVQVATAGAAVILGGAGIAAVVALSPSLGATMYQALFGITLGGLTGGIVAVVAIGISAGLATLRQVDHDTLKRLSEQGDPGAEAMLRKRRF